MSLAVTDKASLIKARPLLNGMKYFLKFTNPTKPNLSDP